MKLRKYQQHIIEKVYEFVKTDEQELIIKLHTGLGKTFLMPRIAKQLKNQGYKVLVLSDISELIKQLEEHFNNMSLIVSKIVSNNKNSILTDITLSMEQTLYNRLKSINKLDNLIILYDEAHKRRFGNRFEKIIKTLNPIKLIGFSSTPFDSNGIKMFDNIYEPISYKEAENKGYITPIKYFIPKVVTSLDFDSIDKVVGSDYTANDIRKLYGTDAFKKWFIDFFNEIRSFERHTIVFVSNIEMAEEYKKLIGSIVGLQKVEVVHSKIKKELNNSTIESFKLGLIDVLVSVTSLTTGFDAPNINTIISLRPTKSKPLLFQKIGRGSRLYDGKKYCEYYDITNNLITHGLPETFRCFNSVSEIKEDKLIDKLVTFSKEPIIEVNEEILNDFEIKLEEMQKNTSYHLMGIEELKIRFELSESCKELILIGNEVARKYNIKTYSKEYLINAVATEMDYYLDLLTNKYNKKKSTLKAYKTRIRNIIQKDGKLASMKYFPKWFYENVQEKYGIKNIK